jgi:hypothetical protein
MLGLSAIGVAVAKIKFQPEIERVIFTSRVESTRLQF